MIRLDNGVTLFVKSDEIATKIEDETAWPIVVEFEGTKLVLVRDDEPENEIAIAERELA
tara:strand:- start:1441 stop:1617 length:177 start_codon:yes stop_codon:yes gene_type:complete